MEKKVHKNFIRSSNLIFIILGLGLINLLLPNTEIMAGTTLFVIGQIVFILGLGFLIRQGLGWVKYLLLILTIMQLMSIPVTITYLEQRPIVGLIDLAKTVLLVWAMVFLFKIPKASDTKPLANPRS